MTSFDEKDVDWAAVWYRDYQDARLNTLYGH